MNHRDHKGLIIIGGAVTAGLFTAVVSGGLAFMLGRYAFPRQGRFDECDACVHDRKTKHEL